MHQSTKNDSGPDRITIGLIKRSAHELAEMVAETGLSKTDLINRAVGLYYFITSRTKEGWEIVLRPPGDGEAQILHIQ